MSYAYHYLYTDNCTVVLEMPVYYLDNDNYYITGNRQKYLNTRHEK